MKIGDAARSIGVAAHVLRHWDDEGVVVPHRTPNGHREYTEEHLYRIRIVMSCKEVGMSLPEIRLILTRREPQRAGVIEQRLRRIQDQRRGLERAEKFLVHVLDCTHDLLSRCDACMEYGETLPRTIADPAS